MKRYIAMTVLAYMAVCHVAAAQSPPVTPPPAPATVPAEALTECQDFTYALRTQREQVLDAAAAAHAHMTQQARQIAALQQENATLKAELAKLRAAN
jgi:hypothetical protein